MEFHPVSAYYSNNTSQTAEVAETLLIKPIKNKPGQNFIIHLSSATCFGFVSHLQPEYTFVV